MSLLEVQKLSVCFPARNGASFTVVDDVSFSMQQGEVFAIVGESGSGKSMIARSIVGLLPARGYIASGEIRLDGTALVSLDANGLRQVRGSRIGMVFQEPMVSLNPTIRIGRQIAEAAEQHSTMTPAEIEKRAIDLLDRVKVAEPRTALKRYPIEFSGGMCQRIMIASALMLRPTLVIADEPTTALDRLVQQDVLETLLEVTRQEGASVLLISHDLSLVAGHSNSVAVLQKGRIVEQGPSRQVFERPVHDYTQTLLDSLPSGTKPAESSEDRQIICAVDDVCVDYPVRKDWFWQAQTYKPVLKGVSMDIYQGETVALVGESGSGKSTLGRAILQLVDVRSGSIAVGGKPVSGNNRPGLQAMSRIVQLVFQNPYAALSPRIPILATIAEPLLCQDVLSRHEATSRAREMLHEVGLGDGFENRLPHELSGGQRQRVSLARALIVQPRLIIADEPVSALDVSIQARILELLHKLQQKHAFACLFISHDLGVVESIADRVFVLYRGEIVESGPATQVFNAPRHHYTRALLSASPELRKLDDNRYELRAREFPEI